MILCLFICAANSSGVAKESELACKVVTLHKECSGCSLRGTKAVLEVLENRMQIEHKSACQVVKAVGQFSWAASQKSWKFSEEMLTRYFVVLQMEPVVGKGVIYFNNQPFTTFGRFAVRIENHWFYFKT